MPLIYCKKCGCTMGHRAHYCPGCGDQRPTFANFLRPVTTLAIAATLPLLFFNLIPASLAFTLIATALALRALAIYLRRQ